LTAHLSFRSSPGWPTESDRRSQRGTSFAELMLAVLIISTTVVASHSSLTGTVSAYHYFADGEHESLLLAKEIHEAALLLPWAPDPESSASFGADVHTLFEMDEKVYAPPRSAGYDVVTSHLGWSQTVDVKVVNMADPTAEVDPATFGGAKLTELSVTVKDGEKVIGTHHWWLTDPTAVE
jgi:hypothetical protein